MIVSQQLCKACSEALNYATQFRTIVRALQYSN